MRAHKHLPIGIQTNGVMHTDAEPAPDIDTKFRMVKEAGVFDYVDKTPPREEIGEFLKASAKYGLPIRAGGFYYMIGRDEELLEANLRLGKELGSSVHNVQIFTHNAEGRIVSDRELIDTYRRAYALGDKLGVVPCIEVHVNMWSEDFRRVAPIGRAIEAEGMKFNMTLDHSHVIFKIDNPDEQEILDIRADVESGKLVLDPSKPGNVTDQWIAAGWVRHCHARAAIPNNPRNTRARYEDGRPGRGIQYPFVKPGPQEWHAAWDEAKLEPWKQVVRSLLRFHAANPGSVLGQISTEFIPALDYGMGARYSIFEQGVACARWLRETWEEIVAERDRLPAATAATAD
jgi:hypothetical protein